MERVKMKQEKLSEIMAEHAKWLAGHGGKCADLKRAYLFGANLHEAYLRYANLCGADMRHANLSHANLSHADLCYADLCEANLRETELCHADLRHAELYGADLCGADLSGTNLKGTNLSGANLIGAILPVGIYQVVGAGSSNRCTTYDSINDRVICGCWDDGKGSHLDSFARRIEEIYGTNGEKPNPMFYTEYMSTVEFFKTMRECVISTVLRG